MATAQIPIRTEAEYEKAMAEVATLWGATTHTPNGDRLDLLATQIDAYEAKYHAMDAPVSLKTIAFRKEQQGIAR